MYVAHCVFRVRVNPPSLVVVVLCQAHVCFGHSLGDVVVRRYCGARNVVLLPWIIKVSIRVVHGLVVHCALDTS